MPSKSHAQDARAHAHAHGPGHEHEHENHDHDGHAHHDHDGHAHHGHAHDEHAHHDHAHHGHAHHRHAHHGHAHHVHVEGERPWAARTSESKNEEFSAAEARQAKRLKWVLATVSAFFAVEFAGARMANSAVLEADALHLLMDVFALGMSLYAMRLAVRRPSGRFTFGLRRAEPLAALLNAGLILLASAEIVHEGIDHLRGAEEPKGSVMLVVAIGALVVNGISAWLLHGAMGHHGHDHDHDHGHHHGHGGDHAHAKKNKKKGEKGEKAASKKGHHLNLRGAWLHLMGDTLGSVAALVAALVVKLGGPAWADPVASFLVVLILVFGALRLVRDALVVLLEIAPKHLPLEEVREALLEVEGVARIDALHVWTLGGGQDAIMATVTTRRPDSTAGARATAHLRETFELDWVTVQADDPDAKTS